jgi:hypothetical protein
MKFSKQNSIRIADEEGFFNEAGIIQMAEMLQGKDPTWNLFCWNLRHLFPDHTFVDLTGSLTSPSEEGVIHYSTKKVNGSYTALAKGVELTGDISTKAGRSREWVTFCHTNSQGPDYYIGSVFYRPDGVIIKIDLNSPDVCDLQVIVVEGKIRRIIARAPEGYYYKSIHPCQLNPSYYYSSSGIVFLRPLNLKDVSQNPDKSSEQGIAEMIERGMVLRDVDRWEWD